MKQRRAASRGLQTLDHQRASTWPGNGMRRLSGNCLRIDVGGSTPNVTYYVVIAFNKDEEGDFWANSGRDAQHIQCDLKSEIIGWHEGGRDRVFAHGQPRTRRVRRRRGIVQGWRSAGERDEPPKADTTSRLSKAAKPRLPRDRTLACAAQVDLAGNNVPSCNPNLPTWPPPVTSRAPWPKAKPPP